MEEFQIIPTSPALAPYVKHYWSLKTVGGGPARMRTVPTGHICLMFHRGERIFSRTRGVYQPRSFISGQDKTFSDLIYSGPVDMLCVVFRPAGAGMFFRVPVSQLGGLQTDINDLGDAGLTDLGRSMDDAVTSVQQIAAIERFLTKRLAGASNPDLRRLNHVMGLIDRGPVTTALLAEEACLSPRQFNRVFTRWIGAGPKEFLRTVRFQRALHLMQYGSDIPPAQLAADCGYYDQPHLIKEFRAFSGYTPLEYAQEYRPYSDYFS